MKGLLFYFFLSVFPGAAYSISPADTNQIAEKVYLQVDRTQYATGEDIWFKGYVIDPSSNRLSLNTNNLHVELIGPDSKILLHNSIRIENGTGNGDFSLNDSLLTGTYRIRAYTNHMRNYDENFYFIKKINVINPYEEDAGLRNHKQEIPNKIDISFFPEGGSLVDNVTSTVAFKTVDILGNGCDVTVELCSSEGEIVTIFNSTHLGMGFFNLKPVSGLTYYAIVKSKDGTETKADLPGSFPSGVAIRTFITPEKNLILTVNTNDITLPSVKGHMFTVNLSSRGLVNRQFQVRVDSLINNYLIPLQDFPEGIMRVTIAEFEGLPLAERLFFLRRNNNVRLNVTTDKAEYKKREKVSASLSLSCDSTSSGIGDFSLSAADERYADGSDQYPSTIASWFLLESDVRGKVEKPSYYFDPDNKKGLQDLDLLLMTQGWRDFKWKYDTVSSFKHETGYTISGNVRRIINNKPIEGAKINLGLFSEKNSGFLSTETDKKGLFLFEGLDIYGNSEAFISSTGKFEKMAGRIVVDSTSYLSPAVEAYREDSLELRTEEKNIAEYKLEATYKLELKKKYKLSDTINVGEVIITATKAETPQEVKVRESRRIYATPDKELIIPIVHENYPGDVFSYISGRIPGVRVLRGINPNSVFYPDDVKIYIRGQFSEQTITLPNGGTSKTRIGAMILLDGYELDSTAIGFALSMPMYQIDRIDVLNASPLYGMRGANGVINIITKRQIRRVPAEPGSNSRYLTIKGFDVPRVFYSPTYDDQSDQTNAPDFRSTIYWKPVIKIDGDKTVTLEFYNSDNTGTNCITVEGITNEGIPLTGRVEYIIR